jgi:hypothetical protein
MRARGALAAAAVALTLAGCVAGGVSTSPTPPERPDRAATPAVAVPGRSDESLALEAYYGRVQADLLARGLLRRDSGGPDTPFDERALTENFIRIALFDEYVERAGTMIARQTESRLRRWSEPVRLQVTFGALVPEDKRAQDLAAVEAYANRLSQATRHPIFTVSSNGNFHVVVLNEDERRAFGPQLRRLVPGVSDTVVRTVQNMPRSTFCLVFAFSEGGSSEYVAAVAIIRAEHPDLLRLSCLHEEIAQGLGLANDSPRARPSIFNDDEEFALLTTHDELLLRMLYDSRLTPGMRSGEAEPIVRRIAEDLVGGPS